MLGGRWGLHDLFLESFFSQGLNRGGREGARRHEDVDFVSLIGWGASFVLVLSAAVLVRRPREARALSLSIALRGSAPLCTSLVLFVALFCSAMDAHIGGADGAAPSSYSIKRQLIFYRVARDLRARAFAGFAKARLPVRPGHLSAAATASQHKDRKMMPFPAAVAAADLGWLAISERGHLPGLRKASLPVPPPGSVILRPACRRRTAGSR